MEFCKELEQLSEHEMKQKKNKTKEKPLFKCWIEDWEKDHIYKKDPVSKQKLLRKYGGLTWIDIDATDNGNVKKITSRADEMQYASKLGWMLLCPDPADPISGEDEPWTIEVVLDCLLETDDSYNNHINIVRPKIKTQW